MEYDFKNGNMTFHFGHIGATSGVRCSLDGGEFGSCKLSACTILVDH